MNNLSMMYVLYINRRVVMFLISLVIQMETFAQRGRFIPQDWGDGGGSYSYNEDVSFLLFCLLIAVVLLALFIASKIKSISNRNETVNPKSKLSNSPSSNGSGNKKAIYSNDIHEESPNMAANVSETFDHNRFASAFDEHMYYERIAFAKHLLNKDSKPSEYDVLYLKRYGMTVHEHKQYLHNEIQKRNETLLRLYLNSVYLKIRNGWKEVPYELIEKSKARVIALPKTIEKIDIKILSRFDIVIVPNEEKDKLKKLLVGYNGKVADDSVERIWVGSEMTPSAYIALHGEYELTQTDENKHFLKAKDGTCAYFVQELEDSYAKSMNLNLSWLKVREFFSMQDKKFHFGVYYNHKE